MVKYSELLRYMHENECCLSGFMKSEPHRALFLPVDKEGNSELLPSFT
jgi:hypothetical protein